MPFFQQQISRELKKMESPPVKDTSNTQPIITDNSQKLPEIYTDRVMNRTNIDLIVAVLIATVTFAAALTLPGGYKSDGAAVLQENRFFQMFMVFNCFSFYSSAFVILATFFASFLSSFCDSRRHNWSAPPHVHWRNDGRVCFRNLCVSGQRLHSKFGCHYCHSNSNVLWIDCHHPVEASVNFDMSTKKDQLAPKGLNLIMVFNYLLVA